jgi:hypothetical protein
MGQLLAILQDRSPEDVFLDLENAKPQTDQEKEIYQKVGDVLDKGPDILKSLLEYKGCEEHIRKAITTPTQENEEAAWNAVLPAVDRLQEFYEYSQSLDQCFPQLLVALCKNDPKANLTSQQALAKQLANVFDFVLRFDDAKMVNPAIQNDFSYYRRTLNRMKLTKKDTNIKIRDELANRMSLFFAYPTPMMKVLSETTAKFIGQDSTVTRENVITALATMGNVCQSMVDNKRFASDGTNMFCLRAMTGSIILFDHINPQGAFFKKSPVHIKQAVLCLKHFTPTVPQPTPPTEGLLNALRFTTIHLNDPETPNGLKQLLA